MSSVLSTVNTNPMNEGLRIVISGVEKAGKTTLAAGAPSPLLIPLEVGYNGISIPKTKMIENYGEVMSFLQEVTYYAQRGQFPYRTLVFDSATALERLIHDDVLHKDPNYIAGNKKAVTMETALGGYGKSYTYANETFDKFLKACDVLAVYGGINIVLTCHVFPTKMVDPNAGEYDSWDLLLHSPKNMKTYGKREMITQWADIVGFLYEPMYITKGDNVSRGVSANRGRVLAVSRTPSYVAGNRFGIEGEVPIPKVDGWNHFANALYQSCGIDIFTRK